MREKSKAMEDKVARLMESYAASKTSWDKEVEKNCSVREGSMMVTFLYNKKLLSG